MTYISAQYKPQELQAVLDMLKEARYTEAEATALIKALHGRDYRIVKTGKQ